MSKQAEVAVQGHEPEASCQRSSLPSRLWCVAQGVVPQFFLTRIAAKLAKVRRRPFKQAFINAFIKLFSVDMSQAGRGTAAEYEHFEDFFTRELRPGIRPLAGEGHFCCPVDGTVSQSGNLDGHSILQAKGMYYNLSELFAGYSDLATPFVNGKFVCMYLSPRDYHRVHAPTDCVLQDQLHVPGKLFAVGPASVRWMPKLFSRNERLLMLFNSRHGKIAVIMVGACMVGSIETLWTGRLPLAPSQVNHMRPEAGKGNCGKGDGIARFHFGSSVVILAEKGCLDLADNLAVGSKMLMGQSLGKFGR